MWSWIRQVVCENKKDNYIPNYYYYVVYIFKASKSNLILEHQFCWNALKFAWQMNKLHVENYFNTMHTSYLSLD